jgi:outer membrane receptor protein involved in Fe transport
MYKFASERPYYDPAEEFMKSRTPEFHNLSLNFSYQTSLDNWGMVFYGGIENLLNRENIVGFQFKENNPDPIPILPELGRSYYLGIRMSIP